jgi:hypothetical protein
MGLFWISASNLFKVYLFPFLRFDYGEVVLLNIILLIHRENGLFSWCAQHFDNFHQLIILRLAHKGRLAINQLNDNAANGPHIYLSSVVRRSKDELRSPVAPRANISDVCFSCIK